MVAPTVRTPEPPAIMEIPRPTVMPPEPMSKVAALALATLLEPTSTVLMALPKAPLAPLGALAVVTRVPCSILVV